MTLRVRAARRGPLAALVSLLFLLTACAPLQLGTSTPNSAPALAATGGTPGAGGASHASGSASTTAAHLPAPFGFSAQAMTSPDGVRYLFYSGHTATFDGLPLAADVTLPANARFPLPLIVMLHGWGQSRTAWESTTITNGNPNLSNWNNVAFAARGYAVLNFTARGWHDSCGPDQASAPDNQATLPASCTSHAYWVHLSDPRYEIHDAQYLLGALVDEGVADPRRLGVTGDSYGGGETWLMAILNDRVMNLSGQLVAWRSPKGIPLHIAAAVPEYTWASLTNSLVPNGRQTISTTGSPALFDSPVGVPIQSYVTGLYADGPALRNGFYAPPAQDATADLTTWFARISAGNPYQDNATTDPVVYQALQQLDERSPLYYTPDANVPVYQVQGLTDPLFPPVQALMMRNHVLAWNARYPITSFFGDIGHSYADNPADVWAAANRIGNAFFDHYLLGKGSAPATTVTAMTTECVAGQTRVTYTAPTFAALSHGSMTLTSSVPQTTSNVQAGPEGPATDPIANSGCRGTAEYTGLGVASYTFSVGSPYTLLGAPQVTLNFLSAAADAELDARLWDVGSDGTETLIARGTYRYQGNPGEAAQITYQLSANAWQMQAGHTLRLELTGNDSPYYQADSVPGQITITNISLTLPTA